MPKPRTKTNPILPLGAIFIVVVVLGALWLVKDDHELDGINSAEAGETEPTSIDADSPTETIRSLRGDALRILEENKKLTEANQKANEEFRKMEADRLAEIEAMRGEIVAGIMNGDGQNKELVAMVESQYSNMTDVFNTKIIDLEQRLAEAESSGNSTISADELSLSKSYASGDRIAATDGIDIVFVESLDQRAAINSGFSGVASGGSGVASDISGAASGLATGGLLGTGGDKKDVPKRVDPNVRASVAEANKPIPPAPTPEVEPEPELYFTLPDLSVLGRASALTALMGKVYKEDKVINPAPVKVIIGRENLTANFKDLPQEIDGMIFGGYAVGNKTFACVEVNLTAATFIFSDGAVRSAYVGDEGSRPSNDAYRDDSIGYIADPYGNPCIPGEYVTDAPEKITALIALNGAEGYARALRQQEIETSIFSGNGSDGPVAVENLTGSATRFAAATGLAEGLEATAEFYRENVGEIFQGYYVPAGISLNVHLEQELRLDKDPNARQIRYNRGGASHARLD